MDNFEPNFTEETVLLNEQPAMEEQTAEKIEIYDCEVVEEEKSNVLGIVSMSLSIAGLAICCCCKLPILNVVAIVLSLVEKSNNKKMSGYATAGLIISIVIIALWLMQILLYIICMALGLSVSAIESMMYSY